MSFAKDYCLWLGAGSSLRVINNKVSLSDAGCRRVIERRENNNNYPRPVVVIKWWGGICPRNLFTGFHRQHETEKNKGEWIYSIRINLKPTSLNNAGKKEHLTNKIKLQIESLYQDSKSTSWSSCKWSELFPWNSSSCIMLDHKKEFHQSQLTVSQQQLDCWISVKIDCCTAAGVRLIKYSVELVIILG